MRPADVPAADRLREQAGWNQTHDDWQRLLQWQPDGCFLAEDGEGVVASVTTTAYAGRTDTAWLGMLLVEQARRRQGIARTMLSHAVDWLAEHGVASVALDATPLGKTLYDQTGFRDVYTLQRQRAMVADLPPPISEALRPFQHDMRPPVSATLRPFQHDDIACIADLDTAAFFGLDRRFLLRDLYSAYPAGCWSMEAGSGAIDGYVFSRPGARAWYIGPLIARDAAVADVLLRAALAPLAGNSVIVDTLDPNSSAGTLAARYGFEPVRPFIRMLRGAALPASRTDWYFAMAGPEIG